MRRTLEAVREESKPESAKVVYNDTEGLFIKNGSQKTFISVVGDIVTIKIVDASKELEMGCPKDKLIPKLKLLLKALGDKEEVK